MVAPFLELNPRLEVAAAFTHTIDASGDDVNVP
jgi:hypothetical protein